MSRSFFYSIASAANPKRSTAGQSETGRSAAGRTPWRLLLSGLPLLIFILWCEAAPAGEPDPRSWPIREALRPTYHFANQGDLLGLAPEAMAALGLKNGDAVAVRTQRGDLAGVRVQEQGDRPHSAYMRSEVRERLGVDMDGRDAAPVALELWRIPWEAYRPTPSGENGDYIPQQRSSFNKVKLPGTGDLVEGSNVGLPLEVMLYMGLKPGDPVRISGPKGKALRSQNPDLPLEDLTPGWEAATVQVLDGGPVAIFMNEELCEKIGTEPGDVEWHTVWLSSIVESPQARTFQELFWYEKLESARYKAREENRPVLIYLRDADSTATLKFNREVLGASPLSEALSKCRKFACDPRDERKLVRDLGLLGDPQDLPGLIADIDISKLPPGPIVVLESPEGERLATLNGSVSAEDIRRELRNAVEAFMTGEQERL